MSLRPPTFAQRLFLFAILTTVVSPAEFLMDIWESLRGSPQTLLSCLTAVLVNGPLYFFSLTLGIATLFEIRDNPITAKFTFLFWVKVVCLLPLVLFILEYLRIRHEVGRPDLFFNIFQVGASGLVLLAALLVKILIYKHPNPMELA